MTKANQMNDIDSNTLDEWRNNSKDHQLIDIREPWEREIGHITGSEHITMSTLLSEIEKVSRIKPVVFYCRSGKRSGAVVHHLSKQLGYENILNLDGGITAWAEKVDESIEVA
jgi:rhodanese-related sulfurtransferase